MTQPHTKAAVLTRVEDGPAVVVCNTCRQPADARPVDVACGGALLVDVLRAVQVSDQRYAGIAVQEMACLFACAEACTVHLRAPDKIGYVLGRFAPDEAAARAILDYAVHYATSEHGAVPYAQWPHGVRGHFITRTPPPGFVAP